MARPNPKIENAQTPPTVELFEEILEEVSPTIPEGAFTSNGVWKAAKERGNAKSLSTVRRILNERYDRGELNRVMVSGAYHYWKANGL